MSTREPVPPGYKQTDVGVIPEDWDPSRIDQIGDVKGGKRLPLGRSLTERKTAHPYIRVSNMKNGSIASDAVLFVPEDVFPSIRNYRISADDIYISVAGTLGLVGQIPPELDGANLTENADKITNLKCESSFLYYCLISDRIQAEIQSKRTVGAQPKLAIQQIEAFQIPLPPTADEQRAIAAALSDVDALIGSLDALIAKKREIKQAAMQQLLTGKTRLPGFSGDWEVKQLGEIGSTYGGLTGKSKRDFGHGEGRYITFMNILSNVVLDPEALELVDVKPSESQNNVNEGDLFFNGSSETPEEVGLCALLADNIQNVFLNSFCFGFRFSEPAAAFGLYLAYYFRSGEGRERLRSLAQGATRYNLSKAALLRIAIALPKYAEQTAIAEILSDMDAELAALEAKREKNRALKAGMMQELLTGRIRLL